MDNHIGQRFLNSSSIVPPELGHVLTKERQQNMQGAWGMELRTAESMVITFVSGGILCLNRLIM